MRQPTKPLPEEAVDLFRCQSITNLLQLSDVTAGLNTVIQCDEADLLTSQLPLRILMPVQVQLPVIGKVTAELQKERPEVAIHAIKVIVIDHRCRLHNPGIALSGLRIPPLLGPKRRRLLLSFTDKDDPFLPVELGQPLFGNVVLALSFPKFNNGNVVLLDETLDRLDELPADWRHQCRRCPGLLPVVS